MNRERGFALVHVLIFTALLTCIGIYRSWHATRVIQQRGDFVHALRAEELARENSIRAASSSVPAIGVELECEERSAQNADIRISRRLCSRRDTARLSVHETALIDGSTLHRKEDFPQINYNLVFRDRTSCRGSFIRSIDVTPSGFPLSPLSAIAKRTCFSSPPANSDMLSYRSNLQIAEAEQAPRSLILLAAAGYLDISTSLSLESDLIIVGGGDVRIKKLDARLPARVSIVSATGIIMLEEVTGPAELRLIAWQGVFAPGLANINAHGNLPPLLTEQLLSLTAARPHEEQ